VEGVGGVEAVEGVEGWKRRNLKEVLENDLKRVEE